MNFVALDFETANYDRKSACALGVVVVENGQITAQETWLIKPTPFYFQFTYIHGISEADTQHSPTFAELWHQIAEMIDFKTVIAHNASFDIGVMRALMAYYELPQPNFDYLCTVQIARRTWKGLPHYNLKALSDKFDIPLQHHNALSDTLACAKIMLEAANSLQINTVTELCKSLNIKPKML